MIVVTEKEVMWGKSYKAVKSSATVSNDPVVFYAFPSEKSFRKAFPRAPEFVGGIAEWQEGYNIRPCTCGSGLPWTDCKEGSQYCG